MSQPAMPEAKWLFRRLTIWAACIALLVLLYLVVGRMPADDLATIAKWIIALLGGILTIYLVGPTAEHIAAVVKAWRGGGS